jgi:hypothetical protein
VHIETMGVPQAIVVRKGAQHFAPPPRDHDATPLGKHLREALAVAIGMWPLTCVVLLALGLLWMAGFSGAP